MGFTQHWGNGNFTITPELLKDIKAIIAESERRGIEIRGADGTGSPVLTERQIIFNGDQNSSNDYETFWLENDGFGGSCKTARMPYDSTVCAILLRVSESNPQFIFHSEGDWDDEWVPAREIYESALNREAEMPTRVNENGSPMVTTSEGRRKIYESRIRAIDKEVLWRKKAEKEAGVCGMWMPRAKRTCTLNALHNGPHR